MNNAGVGNAKGGLRRIIEVVGFGATVAGVGIAIFLGAREISNFLHIPEVPITYFGISLALFGFFFPVWALVRETGAERRALLMEREELNRRVATLQGQVSACQSSGSSLKEQLAERDRMLEDLTTRAATLERQLNWKDADGVRRALERAASLWGAGGSHEPSKPAYEDDPVYLQMALDGALCSILNQPIVQRLNHIRQLSFAYLKFRSATHSRLSHSLGACKNADLVMTKVFKEGVVYSKRGIVHISPVEGGKALNTGRDEVSLTETDKEYLMKLAKVTALLHDLGHGPMSHALDIHIGILSGLPSTTKADQYYSKMYVNKFLRPALAAAGLNPDDVISLMEPSRRRLRAWFHFVADLVDSSLDVDRMDYLARDAHMTGLSVGALNMHALIERVIPFKAEEKDGTFRIELAFDRSAVEYIEQFVYARDVMYISCYEHPKKIAAEKMLGKAFRDFLRITGGPSGPTIGDLALLTDHELVEMMLSNCGAKTVAYQMLELLMKGITFDLLEEIPIPLDPRASNKRDMFANLPDKIQPWAWAASSFENESAYIEIPDTWARELADMAKIEKPDQIIIAVPSWTIVDKWRREARIRVLVESPDGADPPNAVYGVKNVEDREISPVVADFVYALMRVRLKVRVFVHPLMSGSERRRLRESVAGYFGRSVTKIPTAGDKSQQPSGQD